MKLTDEKHPLQLIELKPDRYLLDSKFTGYKLSLSPIPVQTVSLKTRVDKVGPAENQYALQHVTLFATHNLIFHSPWLTNAIFYVDECWNVYKATASPLNGRVEEPRQVWSIPVSTDKRRTGRFNVSMAFPSAAYVVVADGCGGYYLLACEDDSGLFKEVFKHITEKFTPCVIVDTIFYDADGGEAIDILLMRIEEKSDVKNMIDGHDESQPHKLGTLFSGDHSFLNLLQWVTIVKGPDNSWSSTSSRLLAGANGVTYACIEPSGSAVYIDSEGPYYFIHDTESPISFAQEQSPKQPAAEPVEGEEVKPDYLWSQTPTELTMWFNMSEKSRKEDIVLDIRPQSISLIYKNTLMLEGKLCHVVKADETVWTVDSGKLEISLTKAEENLMWTELIPGNKCGEQILDAELIQEIHSKLGHLCSDKWEKVDNPVLTETFSEQLEECDRFPEDAALMRIDRKSHNITHQISLTNYPVLFTTRREGKKVPAFCARYQEDGLIWQPESDVTEENQELKSWSVKHFATFSALGYVQASKSQRKFTVSPPDFSYAAICDATKHIYIYRQPEALQNQLRNRKTGEHVKHVSSQQVISVDPPVEILGAHATPEYLFILTANHLHAYQMKEEDLDD